MILFGLAIDPFFIPELTYKLTIKGEENGFVEPKVAGLWKIALKADFDDVELESLREELRNFEINLFFRLYSGIN